MSVLRVGDSERNSTHARRIIFGNSPNYQGVHHLHVWCTLISCLSKIVSASPFAASSPNDRNMICSYRIALLTLHNDPWPAPPGPTDILQLFSWLRNVPQMSCWKLSNLRPVHIWKQTNTVCSLPHNYYLNKTSNQTLHTGQVSRNDLHQD